MNIEERAKRMREAYLADDKHIAWKDIKDELRQRWMGVAEVDAAGAAIGIDADLWKMPLELESLAGYHMTISECVLGGAFVCWQYLREEEMCSMSFEDPADARRAGEWLLSYAQAHGEPIPMVQTSIGYRLELTIEELREKDNELLGRNSTVEQDREDLLTFIQSRIVPIHATDCRVPALEAEVAEHRRYVSTIMSREAELDAKIKRQRSQLRSNHESMQRDKDIISDLRSQLRSAGCAIERLTKDRASYRDELSEARQEIASLNSPATPTDAQVEELAKVLQRAYSSVNGSSLKWEEWPPGAQRGFMNEARSAYAHIGGMRVSVTEEEIAEAIEGALELESEHQAAAVMALLRERGVVVDGSLESSLRAELDAVKDQLGEEILELRRKNRDLALNEEGRVAQVNHLESVIGDLNKSIVAESEWVAIYKKDRDDALAELAQAREQLAKIENGDRYVLYSTRLEEIYSQHRETGDDTAQFFAIDELCRKLAVESDEFMAQRDEARLQLAQVREQQTAPRSVKMRFDVTAEQLWHDYIYHEKTGPERMQWLLRHLATHAVIDLPEGVPTAEELEQVVMACDKNSVRDRLEVVRQHLAPYLQPKTTPDIDAPTLERLAVIAREAYVNNLDDCWGSVVLAVLAAAKPEVDITTKEADEWLKNYWGDGHFRDLLNSRIRYSVRVPKDEVADLAKVMAKDRYGVAWEELEDFTRRHSIDSATAAFRHLGMEVEG